MKTCTALSIMAIMCISLSFVENYSQPDCRQPCRQELCPQTSECKCGTYKDYCGCCSYCLGCKGSPCSLVAMERCEGGKMCQPPANADALARINGPGRCM